MIMKCGKLLQIMNGIYEISSLGRVRNIKTKRILREGKDKGNYSIICLTKNSKHKTYYIHRLVAIAFIDNKKNLKQINHIDGNKSNNNVENLEWITCSDNLKHAYKNGLKKIPEKQKEFIANQGKRLRKIVLQYDKERNFIKKWDSAREIERCLGINNAAISHCCTGKTKTAGGYIWKYA